MSLAKSSSGVSSDQPSYSASGFSTSRAPAAEAEASSGGGGGCGTVSTMAAHQLSKGFDINKPSGPSGLGLFVVFSLLPYVLWFTLRRRAPTGIEKRRDTRFQMNSKIKVKVGDRELVGMMDTISAGGVSFHADTLLERGGVITLQIASPDGAQIMSVQGCVVWNEANQNYGVQFAERLDAVNKWSLAKTAA
jgi:hypothetical protein